jgi:D-alanine-D-alanine ligase
MKVLVLHTTPPEDVEDRRVWEFDLSNTAAEIANGLPFAAIEAVRGEPAEVLSAIDRHKPDCIFNLCEAPLGQPALEAPIAALFEWIGLPFTGSRSQTLALCRRKDWTSAVLESDGVPVPDPFGFPAVVKPVDEDGSYGVGTASICEDASAVERAIRALNGPAVVQQFLPGREFAVSLWGEEHPDYISIGETRFLNGLRLITYDAKWEVESADYANTPLDYDIDIDPALYEAISDVARRAWLATGIRGYVRIDIRLDSADKPRVLDVNPNPELSSGAGINRAVTEFGWTFQQFVRKQVEWA